MKMVLFLILFLCACAMTPSKSENNKTVKGFEQIPIIDVHVHSRFTGEKESNSGILQTKDQFIKERSESGIVAHVNMTGQGAQDFTDQSDLNIISCYGVGFKVEKNTIEQGLKEKKFKCIKIYLGYIHRFAYSSEYKPVYELAKKYKVPVVFHTGDTYSSKGKLKFSDPITIDEVAVDYPEVTFLIAHLGNPWIQSAAEVAYKNPNVYIDASALLIGKLSEYDEKDIEEYQIKPLKWAFGYIEDPKKFLFGTDWPLVGMKEYLEAYKKAIPKEHWCHVFFYNAQNVFDFPENVRNMKCEISK